MKKLQQHSIGSILLFLTLGFVGCAENKQPEKSQEISDVQEDAIIVTLDEADYEKMDRDTGWENAIEDLVSVGATAYEDSTTQTQIAPENILRIEGIAATSWKGVSGCCVQSTANKQANKAIEQWVGKQILANRPLQYRRSGRIGAATKASCSSRTTWDGKRSCKGSWKQAYYIEFIKQ